MVTQIIVAAVAVVSGVAAGVFLTKKIERLIEENTLNIMIRDDFAYWNINNQWYKLDVSEFETLDEFNPEDGIPIDIDTAPIEEVVLLSEILEEMS
jgi:hypothetical protein